MLKKVLAVGLVVASVGVAAHGGYQIGKKKGLASAPKYMVLNDNDQPAPLDQYPGAQIVVVSPDGIEPGVLAAHSQDGKKILILPESMAFDSDQDQTPAPTKPQQQSERLDHARDMVLKISK